MIEATGDDLVVIADNPAEMVEAQNATIGAIKLKMEHAQTELADAVETLRSLEAAGMATSVAGRMEKRAQSRVDFLTKALQALEAGYVIVPEMPSEVVAIRVRRRPRHQHETAHGNYTPSINPGKAEALPAGEGEYVDPIPVTKIEKFHENQGDGTLTRTHRMTTGEWDTEIALPVEFLRPTVVQRTSKVMMRKIFDEIAVIGASGTFTGARAKKADPMVVGSVIDHVAKRKLWFLVAWFVDTKTI
jgi:hypothetical protein